MLSHEPSPATITALEPVAPPSQTRKARDQFADAWARYLPVAEEPDFYPLLAFLLSTGCRKGEAHDLEALATLAKRRNRRAPSRRAATHPHPAQLIHL